MITAVAVAFLADPCLSGIQAFSAVAVRNYDRTLFTFKTGYEPLNKWAEVVYYKKSVMSNY